jgi:AmmeMemoRadiSam system protein A
MLDDARLSVLANLAADAAASAVRWGPFEPPPPAPADPELRRTAGTFVALERGGELRGCIGSLRPFRPLLVDVVENARGAALRDPRFEPLTAAHLGETTVEVFVLSPPEPLPFEDVEALYRGLRPGLDGLTIIAGGRAATFLPWVWERFPDPPTFVAELCQKVGVLEPRPLTELHFERYSVQRSPAVTLDRELSRQRGPRATWWRLRRRGRRQLGHVARRRHAYAGER